MSPETDVLLQDFLVATLVCMANGLHDKSVCFTIFRKSCSVLGVQREVAHVTLDDFSRSLDRVEETLAGVEVKTYVDYFLLNLHKLHALWAGYFPGDGELIARAMGRVQRKIAADGNVGSWPITDAVYIWPWLHTVAIDMDLNCGLDEKRAFINFVPEIVSCGVCRKHYEQHRGELLGALHKTTCANALLALHTFIGRQEASAVFVFEPALVNAFFAAKYREDYLALQRKKTL